MGGLVTNFTMIDSGYKYLTVSWDISIPTDSCVEEYKISWCLSSSQECPSRPYYTIPANTTVLNITGLNTCMTYNVFVTAIGNGGLGSLESNIFAKSGGGDNLASVSNLSISSISSNTAQVAWERPADLEACVDNYVVCLKNDVTQEVVCDSQTGSYTQWYSGPTLSACTNYTVQVKAQDYSNKMGGNATLTFFTAPDNVPYMYLVSKSAHSALVSWQASENSLCLHQYTLCWKIRDDSNGDYDCDVTPSTLDEYNVTGLDACTDYTVLVRSVGYNNLTSRDYSIHFKTEFEVSLLYPSHGSGCVVACVCVPFDGERSRSDLARLEPSLMSDIAITSSTAHSMRIQWETITNSSACVSLYIVCFGDIGSDEQICTSQPTYSWMWSSGDVLAACSTYNVSLRAQYQDQQFYLGNIVHMMGPEEVQNLTLESRTISSLQISWGIPQDNLECVEQQIISWCYIDPYDEYWETCSPTSNTSVNVNTDISIYNITDLLECSQYSITVTSVTAKGIMAHNVTTKLYTVSHSVEFSDATTRSVADPTSKSRERGIKTSSFSPPLASGAAALHSGVAKLRRRRGRIENDRYSAQGRHYLKLAPYEAAIILLLHRLDPTVATNLLQLTCPPFLPPVPPPLQFDSLFINYSLASRLYTPLENRENVSVGRFHRVT
uniref:Fibronectin type-III domain-containing protein n=1 Tax=Timema douglasi TaxID=61478 RepID=A0A7R8VFB9_TIMDO|nr:unnamed protein product [Timema douglasi]